MREIIRQTHTISYARAHRLAFAGHVGTLWKYIMEKDVSTSDARSIVTILGAAQDGKKW